MEINDQVRDLLAQALLDLGKAYLESHGLTAELEVVRADKEEVTHQWMLERSKPACGRSLAGRT